MAKQVLFNLVSNAKKYLGNGKTIKIISNEFDGKVHLSVVDEGIGIPKEEIEQIFDPFYRAKNAEHLQGTGIGLNIVKQYVKLMEGDISVFSVEGSGTTMVLVLPIS